MHRFLGASHTAHTCAIAFRAHVHTNKQTHTQRHKCIRMEVFKNVYFVGLKKAQQQCVDKVNIWIIFRETQVLYFICVKPLEACALLVNGLSAPNIKSISVVTLLSK